MPGPGRLRRWWRRRWGRCPWCAARLERPGNVPAFARSWCAAYCPSAHYAEERHRSGSLLVYQAGGQRVAFMSEVLGEPEVRPRFAERPRRRGRDD